MEILHEEFKRRATRSEADPATVLWGLAIFVSLLVVLMIVSWIVGYVQQRRPYFSHTLLFLELSRVHRMRLKDISLLWKWTSREKIRPRSLIFVDPGLWQNKIDHDLLTAGPTAVQTDWNRLYVQLFGTFVPHPNRSVSPGETTTEATNSCQSGSRPRDGFLGTG